MGSDDQTQREFNAAYQRLFTLTRRLVTNFFRFDASAVADVVGETMARTFEHWELVRRQYPDAWVVACAKDVCLEHLRANGQRGAGWREASETLSRLSKRQRDIIVVRYLMGCDEPTTAEALGTTVSAVRAASQEAAGLLRVLLDDLPGELDRAAV